VNDDVTDGNTVILVVDDDWMNRELLQTHLERAGYAVITANSGQKALEVSLSRPPHLVLLDVRMHGLSGYEVCARLKAQEATRYVPVIIVTGLDGDGDYHEALEAGADDFLPKPFNSVVMLARIRSLLRIKRLHERLDQRDGTLRAVLHRYVDHETVELILADLDRE
jgi:two-component system cell cycle response regulator